MIRGTFRAFAAGGRAFVRSWNTYRAGAWAVADADGDDDDDWGSRETWSGVEMSRRKAYGVSAWYKAINCISSTLAKTPLDVFDTTGERRIVDAQHPAYLLLGGLNKPNPETLRFHFLQTLTAHAVGHGGGFAYIYRDRFGRPTELLQLRPDRTWPVRENGQLLFVTTIGGDWGQPGSEQRKLLAENVLHIHGLGWDGLTGYSLLDLAAEALGSAIAKEQFGSRFFRNSASPSVVIRTPKKLSDTAFAHLQTSWTRMRTGLEAAHRPAILEEGAELFPFSHSAKDSQLVEAMERDPVLISNFTGVPAYKLGVKGYNSYNSLEIMSQEFLDDAIDPWFVPWEEEIEAKLFTTDEQQKETRRARFRRRELIRVDALKRASIHRTELGGHPYRMVNEVRREENDDPVDGFDFIPVPLNMAPAAGDAGSGDAGSGDAGSGDAAGGGGRSSVAAGVRSAAGTQDPAAGERDAALRELWSETVGRFVVRLQKAAETAVRRCEDFEPERDRALIVRALGPLCRLSGLPATSPDSAAASIIEGAARCVGGGGAFADLTSAVCDQFLGVRDDE